MIFYVRYKETKRLERVKVKAEKREKRSIHDKTKEFKAGKLPWKKPSLDYKAIHEAFGKADLLMSKDDIDGAMRGFIEVLSLHPEHFEANQKLGMIYIHKNMAAKAEAIFRSMVHLNPKK